MPAKEQQQQQQVQQQMAGPSRDRDRPMLTDESRSIAATSRPSQQTQRAPAGTRFHILHYWMFITVRCKIMLGYVRSDDCLAPPDFQIVK